MRKIVELKIEETKTVVGGSHVAAPPVATGVHAPVGTSEARFSASASASSFAALI